MEKIDLKSELYPHKSNMTVEYGVKIAYDLLYWGQLNCLNANGNLLKASGSEITGIYIYIVIWLQKCVVVIGIKQQQQQ